MDGNVVSCEAKQTQRWKTHFETILNKEAPRNQAEIPESKEDLKVNTDPPSAEEVRKAIRTMKPGKAPGADCVSADMLKAGGEVTMEALTEIFEGIWEAEETPGDWKMGLIVKLPKKGDLSLCKKLERDQDQGYLRPIPDRRFLNQDRSETRMHTTPFLFCLWIDWVMKETALRDKGGIKWTFTETFDSLDFADDISLLSHCYSDIQRKSDEVARNAGNIGLQINTNKTKMLRNNSQTSDHITIGGRDIEEVTEFTYFGAKVSKDGNSEFEIKARIRKARGAFAALTNIWNTNKISNKTKIRLFESNVLSVLLYAAESWKVTKSIYQMLEVFFLNKCLRKILRIYWPNQISNTKLH